MARTKKIDPSYLFVKVSVEQQSEYNPQIKDYKELTEPLPCLKKYKYDYIDIKLSATGRLNSIYFVERTSKKSSSHRPLILRVADWFQK